MPDPALVLAASLVILAVFAIVLMIGSAARSRASASPEIQSSKVASVSDPPKSTGASSELLATLEPTETEVPPERIPARWQDWPVVPRMTAGAMKIYNEGQKMGNNSRAFSKVGACEAAATWFLEDFDKEDTWYSLGVYTNLKDVIEYFKGSYGRTSLAARDGARVSTLISSLWADRNFCEVNETPLDCEYRIHKPSFALISIGTNDVDDPEKFLPEMRQVVEITIKHGVVPVLATKADNVEGDNSHNLSMAKLALEYDIPLWNFYASVHNLPNGGLDYDGAHLSYGDNYFDQPESLKTGWGMRNLTALEVLDALMRGVYVK